MGRTGVVGKGRPRGVLGTNICRLGTWICGISYKNGFAGLLVLYLLPVLNPWVIVEMYPASIFFIGITLIDVHQEQAQLVPLPYSRRSSTRHSDRLHDILANLPRCYKDVCVNVSFLAQLDHTISCL